MQHLGERLRLGLEPVGAPLGLGQRLARDVERLAGAGMRGLGAQRDGLGLGDRLLGGRRRPRRAPSRSTVAAASRRDALELGGDAGELASRCRARRSLWPRAAFSSSLRRAVRSASAVVIWSKVCSVAVTWASAAVTALVDARAALGGRGRLALEAVLLGAQPLEHAFRIGGELAARARCPPRAGRCAGRARPCARGRAPPRGRASRARSTSRCSAAAARASASRSAGSAAAASACWRGGLGLRAGALGDQADARRPWRARRRRRRRWR